MSLRYVRKVYKTYLRKRPKSIDDMLKQYGNAQIREIEICRTPLSNIAGMAITLGSMGRLTELQKKGLYDKLFHLSMDIHLDNGVVLGIEKNQRPKISFGGFKKKDDTECKAVNGLDIKLSDLIEKGEKNNKNFWRYTFRDNCQKFINDMITKNNIHHLSKFIVQDIDQILLDKDVRKGSKYVIDAATLIGIEI